MLSDGNLYNVQKLSEYVPQNNVTGDPLSGQAFNGSAVITIFAKLVYSISVYIIDYSVVFPNNPNTFIQARATATSSGVSGAIFRFASQLKGGPQSTFDLPNGFLDITSTVYVSRFIYPRHFHPSILRHDRPYISPL